MNDAGRAMAFLPETAAGQRAVLTAVAADCVSVSEKDYTVSPNAVMLVGNKSYSWADTGYLQAACWQGSTVWIFCDDLGAVNCVYLPTDDPAQAAKLAVDSTQTAIILRVGNDLLTAYAVTGQTAEVETFS